MVMVTNDEKSLAQKKYCDEHKLPMFAPASGYCFNCGAYIYEAITLKEAGSRLITGCPYCRMSYCD